MKRRNFLAMIPLIAVVCCKPKSKGTFEPYVPEDEPDDDWDEIVGGSQNKGRMIYVGKNRVWIHPSGIECKGIQEAIDLVGNMRKA